MQEFFWACIFPTRIHLNLFITFPEKPKGVGHRTRAYRPAICTLSIFECSQPKTLEGTICKSVSGLFISNIWNHSVHWVIVINFRTRLGVGICFTNVSLSDLLQKRCLPVFELFLARSSSRSLKCFHKRFSNVKETPLTSSLRYYQYQLLDFAIAKHFHKQKNVMKILN